MLKRILGSAAVAAALVSGAVIAAPQANAAPAPAVVVAGNGTSNFYGTGGCGVNMPLGTWADIDWTNYDNGANQTIHWTVRTSGAAIKWEIRVNGNLKKSGYGYNTGYISQGGWGRVVVQLRAWVPGGVAYSCSDSYN